MTRRGFCNVNKYDVLYVSSYTRDEIKMFRKVYLTMIFSNNIYKKRKCVFNGSIKVISHIEIGIYDSYPKM